MSTQALTDIIKNNATGNTSSDLILQLLVAELTNIREAVEEVKEQTSKQDEALVDIKEQLNTISTVNLSLQRHETALFGAQGNNGLTGDMGAMKKEVSKLSTFRTQAVLIASGAAFLIVTLKDWFIYHGK